MRDIFTVVTRHANLYDEKSRESERERGEKGCKFGKFIGATVLLLRLAFKGSRSRE